MMDHTRRTFLVSAAGLAAVAIDPLARSVQARETGATAPRVSGGSFGPREPFLATSSDGVKLAGESRGDSGAPEILFVHGLRQSRLSWEKQFVDSALADFRLVSFDLRGHGDSDKPASLDAYSDADLWADDVAAIIAAAGLRRPVLVGWSLGGFVAGAYLRKYDGAKLAGINLVDAVIKLSPDLLTEEAGTFTRTTTSHDLTERTAATAEFLAACFHQPPTAAEMQRMLVVNGMTARAVNEGFVRSVTSDLQPAFQEYHGPILLTHGLRDRLVRVAMSEQIKALRPDSQLSLYADSGHSPFYEEPVRYGRELASFVSAANRA